MAGKSELDELFAEQDADVAQFVDNKIRKLDDAGYDWKIPDGFEKRTGFSGRGLIIDREWQKKFTHRVLSPDEGYVFVRKNSPNTDVFTGGKPTVSSNRDMEALEDRVNETVEELQASKGSKLIPVE